MTPELQEEVNGLVKRWRNKKGSLIMILHEIQDHYGFVPREVALEVARAMNVPLARIWEVLTFYHLFKLSPPGKYVVSVCMGTACYLKGGAAISDAFKERLGISQGQSTEDGLFHLQEVRCLGCCGLAPVVMVNGKIHSKVHAADAQKIIEGCIADHKAGGSVKAPADWPAEEEANQGEVQ